MEIKPNHICANSKCGKAYYACNHCDKTSFKRYTCSPECYVVFLEAMKDNNKVSSRIDVSESEFKEIMNTPDEILYEQSLNEVSEMVPNAEDIGIAKSVEIINKEIRSKHKKTQKKKKVSK